MCRGEPCKAHSYGPSVTDTVTPQPRVGQGFQCLKLQSWVGDGLEKAVSTASTPVMQDCVIHCHITMVGRRKSWVDILEFSQSPNTEILMMCRSHVLSIILLLTCKIKRDTFNTSMQTVCIFCVSCKPA